MILWHSTTVDLDIIDTIRGLRPGDDSWRDWIDMLGPATPRENVVWLTAVPAFAGRPCRWAYKCIIPSTDRKLVKFEKLLRKAGLFNVLKVSPKMQHWYVYFGTIYPTEIARVEAEFGFEDGISEEDRQRFIEKWNKACS